MSWMRVLRSLLGRVGAVRSLMFAVKVSDSMRPVVLVGESRPSSLSKSE